MGNSQSTTTSIVNSVTMSSMTEFVTKNILNTNVDSTNIANLQIKIGVADGCPINATQTIRSKVEVHSEVAQEAVDHIAQKLQADLENKLDQSSEMINGLASLTGGNSSKVNASIRTSIKQAIETKVTKENISNTVVSSMNVAEGKLELAVCRNSPINMSQDIQSQVIAQNIITQVTDTILQNEFIAKAKTDVTQKNTMKNQGLEALTACCGIVAVLLIVVCLALLVMGLSPGGQNATRTMAQKA